MRDAYEDRFVSSAKQRASLDRSAKTRPVNLRAEYYSDVSTELWWSEQPEYDYATDDSDLRYGRTEVNRDDDSDF